MLILAIGKDHDTFKKIAAFLLYYMWQSGNRWANNDNDAPYYRVFVNR